MYIATVWKFFLKKLKIELLYDPAIPILCWRSYPKNKLLVAYIYIHVYFAFIYNIKIGKRNPGVY